MGLFAGYLHTVSIFNTEDLYLNRIVAPHREKGAGFTDPDPFLSFSCLPILLLSISLLVLAVL